MTDEYSLIDPFHEVGKLFPDETNVECIQHDNTVGKALSLMLEKRYSQLPVMRSGRMCGVFSLWSLVKLLETSPKYNVNEILVEDVMETLPKVTVEDSLHDIIDLLEKKEAILVNSSKGLQAIATPIDVLKYFYEVARPYVLLGEIELSLRALINDCVSEEKLKECIDNSLAKKYREAKKQVPYDLKDMTFEDYRTIISSGKNWPLFKGTLGYTRELIMSKLDSIRDIRNDVFHFRNKISARDYNTLVATRDWFLNKARKADQLKGEGTHE